VVDPVPGPRRQAGDRQPALDERPGPAQLLGDQRRGHVELEERLVTVSLLGDPQALPVVVLDLHHQQLLGGGVQVVADQARHRGQLGGNSADEAALTGDQGVPPRRLTAFGGERWGHDQRLDDPQLGDAVGHLLHLLGRAEVVADLLGVRGDGADRQLLERGGRGQGGHDCISRSQSAMSDPGSRSCVVHGLVPASPGLGLDVLGVPLADDDGPGGVPPVDCVRGAPAGADLAGGSVP